MKTQEIYNNVLETRDFQHVSQYARRRQDGDLSHTQITAVIFAPKIAPKGIKLPPKRAAKWSIVRYPTKYKNLVTVDITRFLRFCLVLQRGFPLPGINFDSPGAARKNIPPPKGEGIFFGAPAGISPIGDKLRLLGSSQKKIFPRQKGEGIFFGAPAGISPIGDKLRLLGSSQKKIFPRQKGEGIFFGAPAGIRTPDTLLKRHTPAVKKSL